MTEIINKNNHLDVSAEEAEAWRARVAAVASDDAALLVLVHEATAVSLKIAALEALASERVLRQAMHELRDHDKRLYRAAKTRWEIMHGRRITTEAAQSLIANAKALAAQDVVLTVPASFDAVARELTKLFEEVRRAPLDQLAAHYAGQGEVKGEIVLVVGPPGETRAPAEAEIDAALREAMRTASVRDAAAEVAARLGLRRREVYARALQLKREGT